MTQQFGLERRLLADGGQRSNHLLRIRWTIEWRRIVLQLLLSMSYLQPDVACAARFHCSAVGSSIKRLSRQSDVSLSQESTTHNYELFWFELSDSAFWQLIQINNGYNSNGVLDFEEMDRWMCWRAYKTSNTCSCLCWSHQSHRFGVEIR